MKVGSCWNYSANINSGQGKTGLKLIIPFSCICVEWNGTYKDGVTYPPYIHEVIEGSEYHGALNNYDLGGYT